MTAFFYADNYTIGRKKDSIFVLVVTVKVHISMLSIQRDIADIYVQLEEPEKAVEILKKENPARMNHGLIGNVLASGCKKYEESMEYLSFALLDSIALSFGKIRGSKEVHENGKSRGGMF